MKKIFALFIPGIFVNISFASIQLPSIINGNMVLQQQSTVKLWGWANVSEKIFITTSWDRKTDSTIATPDANWELNVQTPSAGGPYTIILKGENTIVLENIMIGEVWVCSGQSNMAMSYGWGLPDVKNELPSCYNKNIRFFQIPATSSQYPQDNCRGEWTICDSNTLKTFSAVAYFFGKKLNKDLNTPIGLINTSWGATSVEAWTPGDIINNDAGLRRSAAKMQPNPRCPIKPGLVYNAMIAPILNYNIAGAIWYQGEGNTFDPENYSRVFITMVDTWRKAWNKQFPFYYVQIAPFRYGDKNVAALLREQQTLSINHSNMGMIVITDLVSDTNDIHPKNKHDVGSRLANRALAETYHKENIPYKSPMYKSMETQKDKAVISFDNAGDGLAAKNKTITEIYIAGEDKKFYPAEAKIENDKLIVWSDAVKQPAAVRYAFSNTAIGNLFGEDGLPVAPFRTDNWEVDTSKVE